MKLLKFSVLSSLLLFASCEGEEFGESFLEIEKDLSEHYLDSEAALTNVYDIVDVVARTAALDNGDTLKLFGADVHKSGNQLFINYGNGEVGPDGLTRSGKIQVLETGDYQQPGGEVEISFDEYIVENKAVEGTLNVLNHGNDSLSMLVTSFSVGGEFNLNSNKNISWEQGFDTEDEQDDRYRLSGQGVGADASNNTLTADISEQLVFDRTCEHKLVSGVMDLSIDLDSVETTSTGMLDFLANDACENLVRIQLTNGDQEVDVTYQFEGF